VGSVQRGFKAGVSYESNATCTEEAKSAGSLVCVEKACDSHLSVSGRLTGLR